MIDPITLLFWLMALSWLVGLVFAILGFVDECGFVIALVIWLMFSLPLTTLWALVWVILEVFG